MQDKFILIMAKVKLKKVVVTKTIIIKHYSYNLYIYKIIRKLIYLRKYFKNKNKK